MTDGAFGPATDGFCGARTDGTLGAVTDGKFGPATDGFWGATTDGAIGAAIKSGRAVVGLSVFMVGTLANDGAPMEGNFGAALTDGVFGPPTAGAFVWMGFDLEFEYLGLYVFLFFVGGYTFWTESEVGADNWVMVDCTSSMGFCFLGLRTGTGCLFSSGAFAGSGRFTGFGADAKDAVEVTASETCKQAENARDITVKNRRPCRNVLPKWKCQRRKK